MRSRRQSPTVRLRRLAAELRRLRSAADLTQEGVSEQTAINAGTLYRLENALGRPQRRTLMTLLDLYGVEEPHRSELLELARTSGSPGWLQPFHRELPEDYTSFIAFEAEAHGVRSYQSLFIPGLLQTEDYARAVTAGVFRAVSAEEIDRQVRTRLARQSVLSRATPLQLWVIMDEAAIRRMVGGPAVMAAQLRHLRTASTDPHITIQIIPYGAGAHPGMPGSFVFMDYEDPSDPPLVYVESMAGNLFLESEADIKRFGAMFDHLRALALSHENSMALIATVAEAIG
jgi:transcriptional regulator with XRE-family HTH domain